MKSFVKLNPATQETETQPLNLEDVSGLLEQIIDTELNPSVYQLESITIAQSGWTLNNALYEYTYNNALITGQSIVNITLHNESIEIVKNSDLLPYNESFDGCLKLYSINMPNGNITVDMSITGVVQVIPNVNVSAPITGDGSIENPIAIDTSDFITEIHVSAPITGDGSVASPISVNIPSSYPPIVDHSQTSLAINGNNGNSFWVTLSANGAFTLSNIATDVFYFFYIYNSGTSSITITFPNTADKFESATFTITTLKTREVSLRYNGTLRIWQYSGEL